MQKLSGKWVEPTVVGLVTLLLAGGFWFAWHRNEGPADKTATAGNAAPQQASRPASPSSASGRLGTKLQAHHKAIEKLQEQAQKQSHRLATVPPVSQFTFGQFNTLGASHTSSGGKNAKMAAGSTRGAWVAQLMQSHRVDVGAVQEFQRSQAAAFLGAAGSTYTVWPGLSSDARDGENSVFWRKDRFEALKTESRAYPYFGGHPRNFPLVLLRDLKTGVKFWVTSYHNPANTRQFGNQVKWKHRALDMEIVDINALLRSTDQPVIVSGDMNDREDFFCPFARGTGMHSASGGSSSSSGCSVPVRWIDWIMGSDKVAFSGYRQDDSGFVDRTSDHPMVLSEVQVTGDPRDRLDR